ncbi:MAG: BMP family ABC transporter substrate-binding protein [Lachnospiraceae bacterium]|nr:BMP family ABC transporter substrate-binding protein [Lachnospiraceae bacterium]
MKSEMKRIYGITLISAIAVIIVAFAIHYFTHGRELEKTIKAGFVYVGDASTGYTNNFVKVQAAIEKKYDGSVETIAKYNVPEEEVEGALKELVEEGCELIFTASYGYGEKTKEFAEIHPEIQFCQATCDNANEDPVLSNYHTFMGNIYQGRYISGVVAGMKLKELIDDGKIAPEQAQIGYVGAYPFAEVISGYTAFFLGIRSVVPEAVMTVKYTNTWGDYHLEKECAKELIEEGCVIISQHSDTMGPAVACEETDRSQEVYYVSYNESMADIAPTTYLTGSKINWEPYMMKAVEAVLSGKDIEKCVKGNVNGNDVGAGFENGWVQMLEINEFVAAKGTQERVEKLILEFKQNRVHVFQGDYIGMNPDDPSDTIDLKEEYLENEKSSAPTFHYILKDVITIE